jgi:hypothetical protein
LGALCFCGHAVSPSAHNAIAVLPTSILRKNLELLSDGLLHKHCEFSAEIVGTLAECFLEALLPTESLHIRMERAQKHIFAELVQ